MPRRPRVCIFAEYLYPVVSRGLVPFAGGIEVQLAHVGRGLAKCGFDVSVVTCDFGQPDGLQVDGMELLKCYPPRSGLPIFRFFHPRLTRGLGKLRQANADVYIFQGAALWAGIVRDLAISMGRRFVWMVAHDHDVLASLPDVRGPRDRMWAKRAIMHADVVIAQTEKQRRLLLEQFGRESVTIANAVEVPPIEHLVDTRVPGPVAWLATYKPSKRPEWFTRFAERHPEVECRMVGVVPVPPLDEKCWREAREAAQRIPNLEVLPTIPHEEIGAFLRGCSIFTHTSPAEGFPNAFLEAWAHGLPSVTCFDPDGIIERERLGVCRDDYDGWERALEKRLADPELRRAEGARARDYVARHHAPDHIHQRLADVLGEVLGGVPELVG